jgi:type I restriction enzyme, S subunit
MNWRPETIGRVCSPTPFRNPQLEPDAVFEYIDISAVDRDKKEIIAAQTILGSAAPSRARKEVASGDVLVSTVRPNLNAVAMVPDFLDGAIASTGFCVLRADRAVVLPQFLFFFSRSEAFIEALVSRVRGANYPAVLDSDVKATSLNVPSLPEQHKIVEILGRADRLRNLHTESVDKTRRILMALFLKTFGAPETWEAKRTKPLNAFVDLESGSTPSRARREFWGGTVPWASPKDMKVDMLLDAQEHVTTEALEKTNLRLIPEGSVLIVVRGMILSRDVPLAMTGTGLTINQDLKALVPKPGVDSRFIFSALTCSKRTLRSLVGTAAHGTKKLDTSDLMSLPILDPEESQLQFFSHAFDMVTSLSSRIAMAGEKLENVFSVLLKKAFTGDLTPSWREAHKSEILQEMELKTKALAKLGASR